jgi:acyl transferase domain-containing protein
MSADEVAVVGMAARFPGAANVDELWQNLRNGVESIERLSDEELRAGNEKPELLADPAYVRACASLAGADSFDAAFFGMSPREAALMDPQHRVFLETCWAALEDAGVDPSRAGRGAGVFAACGMNAYMMYHLVTNREVMDSVGEWLVRHTGNDMNFLATRVSYELDLGGPSLNVQTACSSSLVAIHLAAQSLLSGECDLAVAGAVTVLFPLRRGYLYKDGEILSPDGHCRPFDARSAGTVFGSGAGAVVLKRLSDARAEGDRVFAVMKGSAVNNDGASKVGYLAPSVDGQASVVSEALAVADVAPGSIGFVEAHGTGTLVGDPIEVEALLQAWGGAAPPRSCALGSVKSNFGHLGEAAGMAGFLKAVLALRHREIPPTLHFEEPNPRIAFDGGPF